MDAGYGPPLSGSTPAPDQIGGAPGASGASSRADHQHPQLTSSGRVILAADGTAAVTYARTFPAKPSIVLAPINAAGRQVVTEVVSDTVVGGIYTGCVIRGSRAQLLPALSGIIIIGPLIAALSNFDIFGGSAAGVEVSVIAHLS